MLLIKLANKSKLKQKRKVGYNDKEAILSNNRISYC